MNLTNLVTKYWMDDETLELWSETNSLRLWLKIEIELAQVQSDFGLIPQEAAQIISKEIDIDKIDRKLLDDDIKIARHPFVPVLRQLEKMAGPEAGGWLHWGATTQNIFDTAQSIQLRDTVEISKATLRKIIVRLSKLADENKETLQAGRTHGQHATPITFGFKVHGWNAEAKRHLIRLERLSYNCFVARLGGAAGVYASMGDQARDIEAALSKALSLTVPDLGTRSDFDLQTEIATVLGMSAAFCERIASDLFFLQRTEVAEIEENHYPERVGSSTMAQKRNPSEAQKTISLARIVRSRIPLMYEAMVRLDEGDAASTGVTDYSLPEFCVLANSTLKSLLSLLETITVKKDAMEKNLDITNGMISAEQVMMKLAPIIGRGRAHDLLHSATAASIENNISFEAAVEAQLADYAELDSSCVNSFIDQKAYVSVAIKIIEDQTRES